MNKLKIIFLVPLALLLMGSTYKPGETTEANTFKAIAADDITANITLDGSTGNIALAGTVDGVDIAALATANTGDQTSIVGITGTIAEFNTAVTDATLAVVAPNGSTTTVNGATSAVDTITLATDDASYLITVYVTAQQTSTTENAAWIRTLHVSKLSGTPLVESNVSTFFNTKTGGGGQLTAGSVTFSVNVGNLDIDVTGRASTTLQWDSSYEIKVLSTN